MQDNYFDDEGSSAASKKSIRQIPIPANRRGRRPKKAEEASEENEIPVRIATPAEDASIDDEIPSESDRIHHSYHAPEAAPASDIRVPRPAREERSYGRIPTGKRVNKGRKWMVWGGAAVVALVLFFSVASLFEKGTVTINLKETDATLNTELSLYAQNAVASSTSSLSYEVVPVSVTESVTLQATQEEEVERKSSGTITIYNDFDENPQELIRTTRFRTPDGKIYRIDNGVTVPGKTSSGPGTVDAVVYADEAGQEYNVGMTTFDIPGFEGTERFEGFYAKSKTAMTGGFSGTVKTVSKTAQDNAVADLRSELSQKISGEVQSKISQDYIAVGTSSDVVYGTPAIAEQNNQVTISVTASMDVPVISKDAFSKALASLYVAGYSDEDIDIESYDGVKVAIKAQDEDEGVYTVAVTGNASFAYPLNAEELAQNIAGKKKSDAMDIVARIPGVETAQVETAPFWKGRLPENPSKIEIILE